MNEQENIKLVQQAYNNFKAGNIEALLNQFSDDIEWQLPQVDNIKFSGKRKGRGQVSEFFKLLSEEQEVREFEPKEFIAQGDRVVVLGQNSWRVKSTGREYKGEWAHVYTVRGGKIVRMQEYTDTAAAASAYQKAQSA